MESASNRNISTASSVCFSDCIVVTNTRATALVSQSAGKLSSVITGACGWNPRPDKGPLFTSLFLSQGCKMNRPSAMDNNIDEGTVPPMRRAQILLVEDSPTDAMMVREILSHANVPNAL